MISYRYQVMEVGMFWTLMILAVLVSVVQVAYSFVTEYPNLKRAEAPKGTLLLGRGPAYTPGTREYDNRFMPKA